MIPKKSLGQHWLHDDASLQAMADAVNIGINDTVLEVGPGSGTLTAKLVSGAKQVIAVEVDRELANALPSLVVAPNLQVVEQDILRYDLTDLPNGYKVVANIPYYLTSHLLRVLCESSNPFSRAALLVQKEVAERVAAKSGGMSLLSVSVQFYCQVSLGIIVPSGLFTPPPKVDSQILILVRRSTPLFPDVDTKQFFRLVSIGFSQRRKTMLNSLSSGLHTSRVQTEQLLQTARILPNTRPQELNLQDWHRLYVAYFPVRR